MPTSTLGIYILMFCQVTIQSCSSSFPLVSPRQWPPHLDTLTPSEEERRGRVKGEEGGEKGKRGGRRRGGEEGEGEGGERRRGRVEGGGGEIKKREG